MENQNSTSNQVKPRQQKIAHPSLPGRTESKFIKIPAIGEQNKTSTPVSSTSTKITGTQVADRLMEMFQAEGIDAGLSHLAKGDVSRESQPSKTPREKIESDNTQQQENDVSQLKRDRTSDDENEVQNERDVQDNNSTENHPKDHEKIKPLDRKNMVALYEADSHNSEEEKLPEEPSDITLEKLAEKFLEQEERQQELTKEFLESRKEHDKLMEAVALTLYATAQKLSGESEEEKSFFDTFLYLLTLLLKEMLPEDESHQSGRESLELKPNLK